MTPTYKKYLKSIGELYQFNNYRSYVRNEGWQTRPILVIPVGIDSRSNWFYYKLQLVGNYDFIAPYHLKGSEFDYMVGCAEFHRYSRLAVDGEIQQAV